MNVHLIVPSFNVPTSTGECVHTAVVESVGFDKFTIHLFNHWDEVEGSIRCAELQYAHPSAVRLYNYQRNRGLAKSWNDGMKAAWDEGADVAVFANADIVFGPGSLEAIVDCAYGYRHEKGIVWCSGKHGKHGDAHSFGFSLFALNRLCYDAIGCFDENFRGAYYEDSDYHQRIVRAGVGAADAGVLNVYHEGSESIFLADKRLAARIQENQRLNGVYYRRKWGEKEEYVCPFDLEAPPWLMNVAYGPDYQLRLNRIEWERRENPYPGFGRREEPQL